MESHFLVSQKSCQKYYCRRILRSQLEPEDSVFVLGHIHESLLCREDGQPFVCVAKVVVDGQDSAGDVDVMGRHVLASDIVEGTDVEDFGAGGAHQDIWKGHLIVEMGAWQFCGLQEEIARKNVVDFSITVEDQSGIF